MKTHSPTKMAARVWAGPDFRQSTPMHHSAHLIEPLNMKFLFRAFVLLSVFALPTWLHANDLTGVELILPEGFKFVSSSSGVVVDGQDKQLAARASGGVTLSVRHEPDKKFLPSDIPGFLEDGKKAMAGQSVISMRSSHLTEELGRTWGVAVIDANSGKKELTQFLLVTSFHDTRLLFEFQGPKKREKILEAAAMEFIRANPFKIVEGAKTAISAKAREP